MRMQAIRASETLYKAGDRSFADDYRALAKDNDTDVVDPGDADAERAQGRRRRRRRSRPRWTQQGARRAVRRRPDSQPGRPRPAAAAAARRPALTPEQQTMHGARRHDLQRAVFRVPRRRRSRHAGAGGAAGSTTMAPSLAGSPRVNGHRDYVIKAVLHGLTGPIDGKTYSQVMVPMGSNKDQWVADVASFVRNSFGNSGDVRRRPPTSRAFVPRPAIARRNGRSRSSKRRCRARSCPTRHGRSPPATTRNPRRTRTPPAGSIWASAASALTYLGWTTGEPQAAGMWLQVELPGARVGDGNPVHLLHDWRRPGRSAAAVDVPARLPRAGLE